MSATETGVLVIGGGAAGIAAARAAHEAGATVTLVTLPGGATTQTAGLVWGLSRDVFRQWNDGAFREGGRYVTVGAWMHTTAFAALPSLLDVSSVTGTLAVVDLPTHPSWSARLVANTLGGRVVSAKDLPVSETFREAAVKFDTAGVAEGIAASLKSACEGCAAVLMPPVLGLRHDDVAARMAAVLGLPVGEAVGAVGDPPGVRAARAVRRWLPAAVTVLEGRATVAKGGRATVDVEGVGTVRAKAVVLATGGLAGGGIVFDRALREVTANVPVWTRTRACVSAPSGASRGADPTAWFAEGSPDGVGVRLDASQRVIDADGATAVARWLFAAGDVTVTPAGAGLLDALAAGRRAGEAAAREAGGG